MMIVEGGREGWRMRVWMATASMPVLPRVFREQDSQMRGLPVWSCQEILWNSIHFASEAGRGSTEVILGEEGML